MNPIQKLMIPGGSEAEYLEQTADLFLCFPALMWREKSVELSEHKGVWTASYDVEGDNCTTWIFDFSQCCRGNPCGWPFTIALYIGSAVLAAPLLGVGLILKKIALNNDERAMAYSEYAVALLNLKTLDGHVASPLELATLNQLAEQLTSICNEQRKIKELEETLLIN